MLALFVTLGIIFAIVLAAFFIWCGKDDKKPNGEPKVDENTYRYGHQFNPPAAVENRLPSLSDIGYMWELTVVDGSQNHQYLKLGLFNVAEDKIVASDAANLTWYYNHSTSFAVHYQKYSSFNIARDNAWRQIVMRLTDWAYGVERELRAEGVHERKMIA